MYIASRYKVYTHMKVVTSKDRIYLLGKVRAHKAENRAVSEG